MIDDSDVKYIEDSEEEDISGLDTSEPVDDIFPSTNISTDDILITEIKESRHQLSVLIKESANIAPDDNAAASAIATAPVSNMMVPPLDYKPASCLDDDFEIARQNLIALTKAGPSIIEDLVSLAKSSEHPNAYKALTDSLTVFSQLNKDLLGLYEQKRNIENKGKTDATGGGSTTNNNVFFGTTDELLDHLSNKGLLTMGNAPTVIESSAIEVKEEDAK